MVEYVEERVLGLGQTGKFLHIVDNQYVDSLVEVDEVVYGVFPYGIRVLHLKRWAETYSTRFVG